VGGNMRSSWYKKGLVVGIIILFLGLSIQPSIGTDIPVKKEIETIEDTEDCKPCELEELLGEENGIKTIGEKLSVIRDKLEENPSPDECLSMLPFMFLYFGRCYFWGYFIYVYPVGEILLPFVTMMFETASSKMDEMCIVYQYDMDCGEIFLCGE
jgi:hypothetical protein